MDLLDYLDYMMDLQLHFQLFGDSDIQVIEVTSSLPFLVPSRLEISTCCIQEITFLLLLLLLRKQEMHKHQGIQQSQEIVYQHNEDFDMTVESDTRVKHTCYCLAKIQLDIQINQLGSFHHIEKWHQTSYCKESLLPLEFNQSYHHSHHMLKECFHHPFQTLHRSQSLIVHSVQYTQDQS